jgi:hypothetical protein
MQSIHHYFPIFLITFSLNTHAGFFNQNSKGALAELQALQQNALTQDYAPISASALAGADCSDLATYASNNQRDLQSLVSHAQSLSQTPTQKESKGGILKTLASTGMSFIPGGSLIAEAATNTLIDGAKNLMSFSRERKNNQQIDDQAEALLSRYRLQQQEGQYIQNERRHKGCIS